MRKVERKSEREFRIFRGKNEIMRESPLRFGVKVFKYGLGLELK